VSRIVSTSTAPVTHVVTAAVAPDLPIAPESAPTTRPVATPQKAGRKRATAAAPAAGAQRQTAAVAPPMPGPTLRQSEPPLTAPTELTGAGANTASPHPVSKVPAVVPATPPRLRKAPQASPAALSTQIPSGRTTRLALVPGGAVALGQSPIFVSAPNVGPRSHAAPAAQVPGSAAPSPPVPSGSPIGGGASGGSGFFFFGVAALLALAGLVVPRVIGTVRATAAAAAPQPFRSLLERPG
jgi:hypothetical protein